MTNSTRTAAFFDLDRTLIAGSSAFVFARAARDAGYIRIQDFLPDVVRALKFQLVGSSDESSHSVRDRILSRVGGMNQADLVGLNELVLPELLGLIRPEARALLDQHHAAGRETWIVSASPIELVEPLAIALGMTGGIGTKGEVDNGVYTGRLDGPFCYGEGKAEAITTLANERGIDLANSWSYSDSMSDIPMMEIVGNAVAVNPDAELATLSRSRGWPVVVFAQRSKMLIRRSSTITAAVIAMLLTYSLGLRQGRKR
jgi:HAD superfamily hydrolase (TIGR01490 family)